MRKDLYSFMKSTVIIFHYYFKTFNTLYINNIIKLNVNIPHFWHKTMVIVSVTTVTPW